MTMQQTFSCAKCGNSQFETAEIRTTGKWSRFFDMQNKKFTTVSCSRCGFTEMYRGDTSTLGNIFDFLSG